MKKNVSFFIIFILMQEFSFAQSNQLLIPYRDGSLWGYCDSVGNIKIPLEYDSACFFRTSKKQQSAEVFKNKHAGIIDSRGNILVPVKFYDILTETMESEIHYFVTIDNQFKRGLYIGSKEVLPTIYSKIWKLKGDCFVANINKKRGLFNAKGREVIPIKYNDISFLKIEGKLLYYKAADDSAVVIYSDTMFTKEQQENNSYSENPTRYYNPSELDSLKGIYKLDKIDYLDNGIFSLEKEGLKGFWIADLRKIVLPKYDKIKFGIKLLPVIEKKYGSRYLIGVMKEGKYAIVNEKGDTVYPFEYDDIINRADNIIIFKKNNKKGATILDKFVKDIPVKYDYLEKELYESNNKGAFNTFIIKLNNRTGYVGQNGIEYFKN